MLRKILLWCGVVASLLYVGADVLSAIVYPGYHSFISQAISELMATGAPTEGLVDPLFLVYGVLMLAFAVGVWISSPRWRVHVTGALLFVYAALGFLGPTLFEMNARGSGGDPSADQLHIALTAVLVLFILAAVIAGASIRGRWFRRYSYLTLAALILFGVLASFASRGLATGEPTPGLGFLERIDVGAFLAWVVVLGISFLRPEKSDAGAAELQPT